MSKQKTDLVVVGGGAAGLFASAVAASGGVKCIIVEPNKQLGRKLRITGKGRCNLTNNCDAKTLLENVPVNPRFLHSAFSRFDSAEAMAFFEGLGLPLKTERGNRVFPVSDSAHDVAEALIRLGRKNGARTVSGRVTGISVSEGSVTGVETTQGGIECQNVLICTGGVSYPLTGSTGDGYELAKTLGHTVSSPKPSLVPLESEDDYCAQMQGFALRNVRLRAFDEGGKCVFEELGEMLFTHFGVSGPLVLSASSHMRDFDRHSYRLSIDLKPGLDEEKLDARLLRDFEKFANRDFANSLGELAGRAMIPVLVRLSGIPADTKVNSITKKQRMALLHLFKDFPVTVSGPRPVAEAIVTSGGINVKEVDPRKMESKLVRGLYFAGEVLDVDAYTGGFNLQIAWSTAYCAAQAVIEKTAPR